MPCNVGCCFPYSIITSPATVFAQNSI